MDTARVVLAGHVLVATVFFGGAVRFALGDQIVGAALQALIGVLIVGLGVAISRIVARR